MKKAPIAVAALSLMLVVGGGVPANAAQSASAPTAVTTVAASPEVAIGKMVPTAYCRYPIRVWVSNYSFYSMLFGKNEGYWKTVGCRAGGYF